MFTSSLKTSLTFSLGTNISHLKNIKMDISTLVIAVISILIFLVPVLLLNRKKNKNNDQSL